MVPSISKATISTSNQDQAPALAIPKRPSSAFFRFANDIRPQIMRQNPTLKMTEVVKIAAQKYNGLPISQKKELSEAYLIEKEKYSKIFEQFKQTPEGQELLEKRKVATRGKRLNKCKLQLTKLNAEMNKPKQSVGPYAIFFAEQMRGTSGAVADRSKLVAEKWKNMSEGQKAGYVKKASEHNAIYEQELSQWKKNVGAEGLAKIEELKKKIVSARRIVKGVVPKPKPAKRKAKKVVAAKKPKAKKAQAKKVVATKKPKAQAKKVVATKKPEAKKVKAKVPEVTEKKKKSPKKATAKAA
jgi:hypothetical protein